MKMFVSYGPHLSFTIAYKSGPVYYKTLRKFLLFTTNSTNVMHHVNIT